MLASQLTMPPPAETVGYIWQISVGYQRCAFA
jgi:hypothetical protein